MPDQNIPLGLCQCGCGQKTELAVRSRASLGFVKGQPLPYVKNHARRRAEYCVDIERGTVLIALRGAKGDLRAWATVDLADRHLAEFRWHLSAGGYVIRQVPAAGGKQYALRLHRAIMGLRPGDGLEVDHRDGSPLNNRRANLRVVTHQQNGQNIAGWAGATSVYRGVSFHAESRLWRARATLDGRAITIGAFDDELDAATAVSAFRAEHMPFTNEERMARRT